MKSRLPVLVLSLLGASCARTLEGPTPQVTGVVNPLEPGRTPAAVCNAQGAPSGWRLDVNGDSFAPLPVDVLTPTSGVRMPVLSVSGSESFELPRASVFFADKTHLAALLPTSATTPAKALAPGLYTLTVTNANDKAGSLESAIEVVPPPTLASATPLDPFSQGTSTRIQLTGTGFRTGEVPALTASATGLAGFTFAHVAVVSATQLTAEVPAATPAGTYDVTITNPEGCAFTLPRALTVVYAVLGNLTVDPRFGWQSKNQSVTLYNAFTSPQVGFSGGAPLVWITAPLKTNPSVTVDVPLRRVAFVSPGIITAVVPTCTGMSVLDASGTCANGIVPGSYALKVRDPAGTSGTIPATRGFTVVTNPPPVISAIAPSAINTNGLPSTIASELVVSGTGFGTGARVELVFPVGNNLRACALPAGATAASATTLSATVPTSIAAASCTETDPLGNTVAAGGGFSLAAGLYVIRVQNTQDPAYANFSGLVVTNPSANPTLGPAVTARLSAPRADFPLVEATDDSGQHYLYALGGTDGTNLLASVEVAPITLFGDVGGDCSGTPCRFRVLGRTPLGVGPASASPVPRRALAAVTRTVANDTSYLYVIGGAAASGELATVERAQVLRQADSPSLTDASAAAGGTLTAGTWYYRISAIRPGTDLLNPDGETLPSDEEPLTVGPTNGNKVTLTWPCSTAAKYRVYRTAAANAASGTELLLDEVGATTGCSGSETYVDNGGKAVPAAADKPLPPGALGRWVAMPPLATKRAGHAAKVVNDAVYVAGGFCSAGCATTGDQKSVERANYGPNATLGAWTAASQLVTGRRHFSLALANASTAPNSFSNGTNNNDAWLLAVGGDQGGAPLGAGIIEVAKVRDTSGTVAAPTFANSSYNTQGTHGGWAEVVANLTLQQGNTGGAGFSFKSDITCPGGGSSVGQCTAAGSFSGTLNAAGAGANPAPRYVPGEVLFRAYIYLAGGFPSETSPAPSDTLDRIIY